MSSPQAIVLVTREAAVVRATTAILSITDRSRAVVVCEQLADLVQELKKSAAPVVLVDIDPAPEQMLTELDRIIASAAETRFIVLGSTVKNEWVLQAMQSGVRHFLLKERIAIELSRVIQKVAPDWWAPGAIVTVLSASGGCGATTLAINVANELRLLTADKTLLVDLDLHYGAMPGYLGLKPQYSVSDVVMDERRLDVNLLQSTALPCRKALDVLASPAAVDVITPKPLPVQHLPLALQTCKQAYSLTVIDSPRCGKDLARTLAADSARVLLAFELNVQAIKVAQSMHDQLAASGLPQESLLLVGTRHHKRNGTVSLKEARRLRQPGGLAARRRLQVGHRQHHLWQAARRDSAALGAAQGRPAPGRDAGEAVQRPPDEGCVNRCRTTLSA
ncbi:MAG: hypothetical protein U1E76_10505 [Planctomycetota bacterium]